MGHWVINGTIWHMLLTCFQDSESWRAVEKQVRLLTENSLQLALSKTAAVATLRDGERLQLQSALVQHCLATPDAKLLQNWLHTYARMVILPIVPQLAQGLVAAWGSSVNVDFSSSDSKQLLPKKRKNGQPNQLPAHPAAPASRRLKRKLWAGARQAGGPTRAAASRPRPRCRRTWGAVTGLFDIPLLPALFATVEDTASKLELLQVTFRPC